MDYEGTKKTSMTIIQEVKQGVKKMSKVVTHNSIIGVDKMSVGTKRAKLVNAPFKWLIY